MVDTSKIPTNRIEGLDELKSELRTEINKKQSIDNLSQTIDASETLYPSNKAVITALTKWEETGGGQVGDIVSSFVIERNGALLCNGAQISKIDYPKLFEVIQYNYGGSGDNFNLPDLRGYYLAGAGSEVALKNLVGAGLPNITGGINGVGATNGQRGTGAFDQRDYGQQNFSASGSTRSRGWANVQFKASWSDQIYGSSSTVRPKSVGVNFFIIY